MEGFFYEEKAFSPSTCSTCSTWLIIQYGCVRSYTVVSLAIDYASAKVLISHTLPHTLRRIVFVAIAINSFSRFQIGPFHAPNCSKSRHFGSKSVVFLSIAAPLEKSCFSVRFVQTYSLDSLPPHHAAPNDCSSFLNVALVHLPFVPTKSTASCSVGQQPIFELTPLPTIRNAVRSRWPFSVITIRL